MPALTAASLLHGLASRAVYANSSHAATVVANTSSNAFQVICAWPVSGQYGPGSRVLYYILVAACVFARKEEWLRNACLAAALLFPAVAAVHGIVLAALHRNGAVDMDVYGAFQLCSIGILAAPVTVRLSRTYFNDPGRNLIFLWTTLVLAGLLSLTVEFYRIKTSGCTSDDSGRPIAPKLSPRLFPYENTQCNLTCSVDLGPNSPMRRGSANNIYVIPAPHRLTFGMGMLLSAACCIPAILSLISMWNKILENNWKRRRSIHVDESKQADKPIEGTNGATVGRMAGINKMVRYSLGFVEIPVFTGAILAILIMGEMNFFSFQVQYQTEPIQSIGQWAPIVGTGFAALGSLYVLGAKEATPPRHSSRPQMSLHVQPALNHSPSSGDGRSSESDVFESSPPDPSALTAMSMISQEMEPTASQSLNSQSRRLEWSSTSSTADAGRRKVAKALNALGERLGTAPPKLFDDSEFKSGNAGDFPEIPGERNRNPTLPQIREQYNLPRDSDGHVTPALRGRSRSGSFNGSVASDVGNGGREGISRAASPQPTTRISSDLQNQPSSPGSPARRPQARRDTLEVPSPSRGRSNSTGSNSATQRDVPI